MASVANHQDMSSDEEMLHETGGHDVQLASSRVRQAAPLLALLGMLCLVAGYLMLPQNRGTSARTLLESPEFADAVAQRMMALNAQLNLPHDEYERSKTRAHALVVAKDYNTQLRARFPNLAHVMERVRLSPQEKNSVLHVMRRSGDARLQHVGAAVLRSLRESSHLNGDSRQKYIIDSLRPREAELRQLHADIFGAQPESLRPKRGDAWRRIMSMDTARERHLQAYPAQPYNPFAPTTTMDDMVSQATEMMEALQAALESMSPTLKEFAKDNNICILSDLADALSPSNKVAICMLKALQKGMTAPTNAPGASPFDMDIMIQVSACPGQLSDTELAAVQALPCDLGLDDDSTDCTKADAEMKDGATGTC